MAVIQGFLQGKKTHLVVAALLVLLGLTDSATPEGMDLNTLREALFLSLISTGKAAFDRWAAQ